MTLSQIFIGLAILWALMIVGAAVFVLSGLKDRIVALWDTRDTRKYLRERGVKRP